MLLRHGHVVAEGWWHPYAADIPHAVHPDQELYVNCLRVRRGRGRLSVDDQVVSFFPDLLPKRVSKNLAAMRVARPADHDHRPRSPGRNLTGTRVIEWHGAFLAAPVKYKPGTRFAATVGRPASSRPSSSG